MLSNAYFLAKFHFDTAENEPAKNLQKTFANFAGRRKATHRAEVQKEAKAGAGRHGRHWAGPRLLGLQPEYFWYLPTMA